MKALRKTALLAFTVLLATVGTAQAAAVLYGVSGDGANTPESLFTISTADASSTFVMGLGNGADGEEIGYNPADGLLYHASGISTGDRFWEAINVGTNTIVQSGQWTGSGVGNEVLDIEYNPATGTFLTSQRIGDFFSTTTAGVATQIGSGTVYLKGLAFNGGSLFGVSNNGSTLYTLNALTGATLDTLTVTFAGGVSGFTGLTTNPDTGDLWAILKFNSEEGQIRNLVTINTTTGAATSVGVLSEKFAGIAFVGNVSPVPAPGALALLGLGLIGLGWRRRSA